MVRIAGSSRMRHRNPLATLFAAIVVAAIGGVAVVAAPPLRPIPTDLPGKAEPGSTPVDVELVLAVDISYSMDYEELALQREGYLQALTSTPFLNALKGGMHGR